MRTKTLLLSAVLSAACVATATAQVYSVNVVGYISKSIPAGFSMISNPLSNGGNSLNEVLTNGAGFGDKAYFFNPTTGAFSSAAYIGTWTPNSTLAPGSGVFYSAAAARTLVFVGSFNVNQAASVNLVQGFQIVGSPLPLTGAVNSAAIGFPAVSGDKIYVYNGTGYTSSTFVGSWIPSAPSLDTAQAFWVNRTGAAGTWTETYNF